MVAPMLFHADTYNSSQVGCSEHVGFFTVAFVDTPGGGEEGGLQADALPPGKPGVSTSDGPCRPPAKRTPPHARVRGAAEWSTNQGEHPQGSCFHTRAEPEDILQGLNGPTTQHTPPHPRQTTPEGDCAVAQVSNWTGGPPCSPKLCRQLRAF